MNDWTPEAIASARLWNSRGTGSMAEKTLQYGRALDEIERLRLMAYQPADKHEPRCDCLHCVPF